MKLPSKLENSGELIIRNGELTLLLLLLKAFFLCMLTIFTTLMLLETSLNQMLIDTLRRFPLKSDLDSLWWEDGKLLGTKDIRYLLRTTSLITIKTQINLFLRPNFLISLKALLLKISPLKLFFQKVHQIFMWTFL